MESRCPPYLITSISVVSLEFEYEACKLMLKQDFQDKLINSGIPPDIINSAIIKAADTLSLDDFDLCHLKPEKLAYFSTLLNIKPNVLYDDYYEFVFQDFSKMLINYRTKNNLSQKKLASMLNVSPTYLSDWERLISYPNREQYKRIIEFLKGDVAQV